MFLKTTSLITKSSFSSSPLYALVSVLLTYLSVLNEIIDWYVISFFQASSNSYLKIFILMHKFAKTFLLASLAYQAQPIKLLEYIDP